MKTVTYIFTGGRKENLNNNAFEAKDFLYGSHFFLNDKNINLEIVEFENKRNKNLLYYFDRVFQKFFSLPFYTAKLTNTKNIRIFSKSDHVVFVNESTAFSSIFLLIFLKKIYKVETHLFAMGLYSKHLKYPQISNLHFKIIKFLILFLDNVYFLGEGELKRAKNLNKDEKKFSFFPFYIDTKFWNNDNSEYGKNILFVGNDGNRCPEKFITLVNSFQNESFVAVSNLEQFSSFSAPNFKLYSELNNGKKLSDSQLKEIYKSSKLVIIPLRESFQPSGQSVALQSMSMGVPVLITKTAGFWDKSKFIDNENIFFVEKDTKEEWIKRLEYIISNQEISKTVATKGKGLVKSQYDLSKLKPELKRYLNF